MKLFRRISVALTAAVLSSVMLMAEGGVNNSFAPYSKFGPGTLHNQGSTVTAAMGGAGVAVRNHNFINVLNPAAVTARDSLAFMGEFGVKQGNYYYNQQLSDQNKGKTVGNTFNIDHMVMSFPIWRSSAFMIGICPYSSVGYTFIDEVRDPAVIGHTGNITDAYSGTGDVYNLYLGAGATFWKRLSIGAQFDYYFGTLEKVVTRTFSSSNYRTIYGGTEMRLRGFSGKVGVQYEQPIGKDRLSFGATYKIPTRLDGYGSYTEYASQSSVVDTLANRAITLGNASIPQEITAGVAYKYQDKMTLAFDYTYSDWRKSGMDVTDGFATKGFTSSVAQSFKLGFEIVPNRNDIRYYMRRCAYRGGVYYKQEYFSYMGRRIDDIGATVGMTLPVFRWLNGISIAVNAGSKGSFAPAKDSFKPVRENYVTFSVSFDIFDIWFVKPKYD